MSLSVSSIRYLAWLLDKAPLNGPVLLLGRQMVFATSSDVDWAIRQQGQTPRVTHVESSPPNIPGLDLTLYGHYTNDITVMRMLLGDVEVDAIDIDSYQNANIIHDLTQPFPEALRNHYGLILDAGTLEHVLECTSALTNILDCLKPGGTMIHMSPAGGYLDHGYYQFSPIFFEHYYKSKGMEVIDMTLVEQPIRKTNHAPWNFWVWNPAIVRKKFVSLNPTSIFCAARKTEKNATTTPANQDFAAYLAEAADSREFETKPWGLTEIQALEPVSSPSLSE
ncbi:hypothetical protein [Pseudomonas sp. COR18]|uniref:hypothetical protein n=1 Tax=Pseudomonas sp. COR18 TaxID=3399680 RepID=UPI003AFFD939